MFPTIQALILAGQMARYGKALNQLNHLKLQVQRETARKALAGIVISPQACAIPLTKIPVDEKVDPAMVKRVTPEVDPAIVAAPPAPSCDGTAHK